LGPTIKSSAKDFGGNLNSAIYGRGGGGGESHSLPRAQLESASLGGTPACRAADRWIWTQSQVKSGQGSSLFKYTDALVRTCLSEADSNLGA